ncbi:MAG: M20/M25/M40 family metallo-hydrolase [Vicinamibacterales bacterium]
MTTLSLLSDLVSVNSINPSLVRGAPGEAGVAEVAAQAMKAGGLDVVFQEAAPGRPNVVGVLEGREPGPAIMLCGHLDTVGVEGMTDPFTPRVMDGRLYGRGAQDMKGGVAAMIAAAVALARDWRRGRLIVACVADEEYESLGADALVQEWTADAAIVTEPTDLTMAVGHKGFAWLEVVTTGRAAHGSRPREGRDAIVDMARVLMELDAKDRELQARVPSQHQGTASLHASIIEGGRELSVYPDRCVLRMERRTVTGEEDSVVIREVNAILEKLQAADSGFRGDARLMTSRPPYRIQPSEPLPRALAASIEARGLSAEPAGMSFWTDAAILAGAGIPSLLFGPGGAGLHSIEEYVNLADVDVCSQVLIDTVRRLGQ